MTEIPQPFIPGIPQTAELMPGQVPSVVPEIQASGEQAALASMSTQPAAQIPEERLARRGGLTHELLLPVAVGVGAVGVTLLLMNQAREASGDWKRGRFVPGNPSEAAMDKAAEQLKAEGIDVDKTDDPQVDFAWVDRAETVQRDHDGDPQQR